MFNLKMPQSIFVHADGFLKASLKKEDPPHPLDMVAMVTASAFASELYLKCLIFLETGTLNRYEHNLRKLFRKLRDETQAEISKRFDTKMDTHPGYDIAELPPKMQEAAEEATKMQPSSLREALKEGADAFIEWRYLYEDADGKNIFCLFNLPPILREIILERRPEWRWIGFQVTQVGKVRPTSPAQKTPEPAAGTP